jgi:hypothetical protein
MKVNNDILDIDPKEILIITELKKDELEPSYHILVLKRDLSIFKAKITDFTYQLYIKFFVNQQHFEEIGNIFFKDFK